MNKTWQRVGSTILGIIMLYVYFNMAEEIFFFILGSLFIIVSIVFLLNKKELRDNGVHADATVVSTRRALILRGGRAGTTYFPVVKYDVDGLIYTIESSVGHIWPRYKDGETVRIIYDKEDVKKIIILDDGSTATIIMVLIMLVGAIMIGVVLYRVFF